MKPHPKGSLVESFRGGILFSIFLHCKCANSAPFEKKTKSYGGGYRNKKNQMFLGQNVDNMIVKRLSKQIFEKNKFGGFMSKKGFVSPNPPRRRTR